MSFRVRLEITTHLIDSVQTIADNLIFTTYVRFTGTYILQRAQVRCRARNKNSGYNTSIFRLNYKCVSYLRIYSSAAATS